VNERNYAKEEEVEEIFVVTSENENEIKRRKENENSC
jgi:hypothetical protein